MSLQVSYNTSLPRSLVIYFEYDLDFRWIYWAETILMVSGKRWMSLKLIKLGLGVGRKKSTLKICKIPLKKRVNSKNISKTYDMIKERCSQNRQMEAGVTIMSLSGSKSQKELRNMVRASGWMFTQHPKQH